MKKWITSKWVESGAVAGKYKIQPAVVLVPDDRVSSRKAIGLIAVIRLSHQPEHPSEVRRERGEQRSMIT